MTLAITMIYARAANGTIGRDGKLPWHLPADLKHFKSLTLDKPMIMGRKTFESLPGLLPKRRHIVLTRRDDWSADGAEIAADKDAAIEMAADGNDSGEVSIVGGAAIYDLFMPIADRIEMTQIHADYAGDARMAVPGDDWDEVARVDHEADGDKPAFSFISYARKKEEAEPI